MKTVLITGGSSGIGEALVAKLAPNPDYLIISWDKNLPNVKYRGVIYKTVDISDPEKVNEAAKDISSIDILINNAAAQHEAMLNKLSFEQISDMIDTNIKGTLNVTRAAIPYLENGLIINVGSVHSTVPRIKKIPYDMSKAAIQMFTKEIALELAEQKTRSVCIEFGALDTPMNAGADVKAAVTKQVIEHLMSAQEAADIIIELTKDNFKYINGSTIVYDCGRSLKN